MRNSLICNLIAILASLGPFAQAGLKINEVFYNVSPQGGYQFVELFNSGTSNDYLDGKILTDEAGSGIEGVFAFPGTPGGTNYLVGPSAFVVIAVDAMNATSNVQWECYAGPGDVDNTNVPNLVLVDGADDLGLYSAGDNIVFADGSDTTTPIDMASIIDGMNFAGGNGELAPLSSSQLEANGTEMTASGLSLNHCPPGRDNNVSSTADFVVRPPSMGVTTLTNPAPDSWPEITLTPFVSGLVSPVDIANAGDGSGRLFVVEQPGRIRIVTNGGFGPLFLNITNLVTYGDEQGLLGVAFAPGYATNRHFYVNYTRAGDGATVVARYYVASNSPNVALTTNAEILLVIPQPFSNHNGGQIAFGPHDGNLYIGMGDGGSGSDPFNVAQNPSNLLGKMLRIGVEPPNGTNYSIPTNNPYASHPTFGKEIWSTGLRNPWRFSFDALSTNIYIADVGQGTYEEVNIQPSTSNGLNYGWRVLEASHCFGLDPCTSNGFVLPTYEYNHSQGCSVTGGRVYRGQPFYSLMQGLYIFGDFCSAPIRGLRRSGTNWVSQQLTTNLTLATAAFGADEASNMYVTRYTQGVVCRIDEIFEDSECDGMPDAWEIFYGLDPVIDDSALDPDGDDLDNLQEFDDLTNPNLSDKFISVTALNQLSPSNFVIRWVSSSDFTYAVEAGNTVTGAFTAIITNLPSNVYTDSAAPTDLRIYRIRSQ